MGRDRSDHNQHEDLQTGEIQPHPSITRELSDSGIPETIDDGGVFKIYGGVTFMVVSSGITRITNV